MYRTLSILRHRLNLWLAILSLGIPVGAQESPADTNQPVSTVDEASIIPRKNARTITLEIPAPRGPILDREGYPFAQNHVVYQLAVQYEQFANEDRQAIIDWGRQKVELAKTLHSPIIEPTDDELYQHYRHRRWLPFYISDPLDADAAEKIRAKLSRGLELVSVYERYYPEETLACHIIGYTGKVGKLPTGPINPNDPLWEMTEGRAGFEKIFDEDLQGEPATLKMVYNERGELLQREQRGQPRAGGAVVTTLNMRWQKRAEKVLDQYSNRGAMVVIDVATGEVLVMASKPGFDLNDWIPGITTAKYNELREDQDKPLYGRAFQGVYPPASSFKPVIALAALNDGVINRNTTINCPAYVEYGNHKLWNWSKSAYGDLSVIPAIKWSNNPWFAQVGNRVGSRSFLDLSRKLGFGQKTGLPLIGEESGLLPTADWVYKTYGRPITNGDMANWSIGQGALLATPLQVAQAMAGIANGGALPKLHLMMQVQDPYGRVIRTAKPEHREWLNLSPEALSAVRTGMREVVSGGTARSAGLSWTTVCGKTGTGQWGPERKRQGVAWFAGFLPADEPRLAFACLYEGRPGQRVSGGRNAGVMVPAFFNSFKDEIKEMIQPAPKAMVIIDEVEAQENAEGIMRAIPVSPIELEEAFPNGFPEQEEIPQAIPVAPEDLEDAPQAIPVSPEDLEDAGLGP